MQGQINNNNDGDLQWRLVQAAPLDCKSASHADKAKPGKITFPTFAVMICFALLMICMTLALQA